MSASPEPIDGPLLAAIAIAILGAVFVCADSALTSLSPARLAALAKETDERLRGPLERAARRRQALQSRYLIGRVLAHTAAVAWFTWWLLRWSAPLLTNSS